MNELYQKYKNNNLLALNHYLLSHCKLGDVEDVNYLLTSPELKINADIYFNNNEPIISACSKGNLPVVKYLLTSPNLQYYADINAQEGKAINLACYNNQIDTIKFLLECKQVTLNCDLSEAFLNCLYASNLELAEYFIWDYQIERTEKVDNYINTNFSKVQHNNFLIEIKRNFDARDLENELGNKLNSDKINKDSKKIKI